MDMEAVQLIVDAITIAGNNICIAIVFACAIILMTTRWKGDGN